MKVNKKYILMACLFVCLLGILGYFRFSYLCLGETHIRYLMLRGIPVGTPRTDVESYLKRKDIGITASWKNTDKKTGVGIGYKTGEKTDKRIGHGVIHAHLGWYQGLPWRVDVVGFLIFDSSDRLMEIKIEKQFDAP